NNFRVCCVKCSTYIQKNQKRDLIGISTKSLYCTPTFDYHVFTDAARFITEGESPYNRSTYRYTPLLAWLLTPNIYLSMVFGKILFVLCLDSEVCHCVFWGIYVQTARRVSSLWLLNPLPMGVSTEDAESILAALVLGTLLCMEGKGGCCVHMKIYPITYALPIALTLRKPETRAERDRQSWRRFIGFIGSFLNAQLFLFASVAGGVFCGFLHETYLYHLTRRDIRHNFSPYFYMLYLTAEQQVSQWLGLAAFIPQLVLLLAASWAFHSDWPFPVSSTQPSSSPSTKSALHRYMKPPSTNRV
uniref:GPI alpha-1,4-mannosyltransferase I, catalytic subunit n=1 Tax=Seriola dumerili TaxID=41447 RepID=A0A3B4TMQ0_SERDU